MYLESIFSAPDIQRQLPAEAKMFVSVDKSYKDIMRKVNKVPLAIRAATQPGKLNVVPLAIRAATGPGKLNEVPLAIRAATRPGKLNRVPLAIRAATRPGKLNRVPLAIRVATQPADGTYQVDVYDLSK